MSDRDNRRDQGLYDLLLAEGYPEEKANDISRTHYLLGRRTAEHWDTVKAILGEDWSAPSNIGITEASKIARQLFKEMQVELERLQNDNPPVPIVTIKSKYLVGEAQTCPVCQGNGLVPAGFYTQTSGSWTTNSSAPEPCKSCGGGGVVYTPELMGGVACTE